MRSRIFDGPQFYPLITIVGFGFSLQKMHSIEDGFDLGNIEVIDKC